MRIRVLAIMAVALLAPVTGGAAEKSEPTSMTQLVEEIHQLRVDIQQSWSVQLRAQLLLEQIKQSRDVMNDLTQTIEISREEALNQARQREDYEEQARELEAKLGSVLDARDASGIKDELRGVRKAIEQSVALESRFKTREIDRQSDLAREEARMAELNKNLVSLSALFSPLGSQK